MRLLVLIPAYNEEKKIKEVVETSLKHNPDVLVIDDGSNDNTFNKVKETKALILKNETNSGKGTTLKRGFNYTLKNGFDAVITLDGDGQHNPDEIPLFIQKFKEGYDLVIGNRMSDISTMPPLRIFANSFSSFLVSVLARKKIYDSQNGFRLINSNVLKNIKLETTRYDLETEILIKAIRKKFKIAFVPTKTIYLKEAKSKVNSFKDTIRFLWIVLKLTFSKEQ